MVMIGDGQVVDFTKDENTAVEIKVPAKNMEELIVTNSSSALTAETKVPFVDMSTAVASTWHSKMAIAMYGVMSPNVELPIFQPGNDRVEVVQPPAEHAPKCKCSPTDYKALSDLRSKVQARIDAYMDLDSAGTESATWIIALKWVISQMEVKN